MTRNDILLVNLLGDLDTCSFMHQPTTDDIATVASDTERYAIQLIGGVFEVYDLTTLRRVAPRLGMWTIGPRCSSTRIWLLLLPGR